MFGSLVPLLLQGPCLDLRCRCRKEGGDYPHQDGSLWPVPASGTITISRIVNTVRSTHEIYLIKIHQHCIHLLSTWEGNMFLWFWLWSARSVKLFVDTWHVQLSCRWCFSVRTLYVQVANNSAKQMSKDETQETYRNKSMLWKARKMN